MKDYFVKIEHFYIFKSQIDNTNFNRLSPAIYCSITPRCIGSHQPDCRHKQSQTTYAIEDENGCSGEEAVVDDIQDVESEAMARMEITALLVLQNDIGNRCSPTVIVAIITSHLKRQYLPTHVRLNGAACGLFRDSMVMLEQLRTLDRLRLQEYMGSVGMERMAEIDAALAISIGLHK